MPPTLVSSPTESLASDTSGTTKEELHFRRIDMRGFRRSDGLFEIEGRVIDQKPYDYSASSGSRFVPANEPIHNLGVRLIFDEDMLVRAVETFTVAAPYTECPEGGRALQALIGVSMTRGWSNEVRSRLVGARSCTHLRELLIPLASAAFQSLSVIRAGRPEKVDANGRPAKIDSCYAYRTHGELVLHRWPQFHRPEAKKNEG
jgi:hypothetical protein